MSGVERLLRTDQSIVVLPEQLDADPWLLNTVSGIVDLRTGSVRPHDPQALCTKITNAPVDRAQGAGLWEAFLGDITQGDAEPKSAKVTACRMLTNANVKAEIDRRVEEYSRTAGLTVVDVLQQLKAIAFSDLRRLFDEHGRLRPPTEWPEDAAKAVAAWEVRETSDGNKNGKSGRSVWKIRLCDKQAALFALLDFLHPLSPPKPGSAQVIGNNAAIDAARALAELRAALRD